MEDLRSPSSSVSLSKESATGKAVFSGEFGSAPRFDPAAARPGDYAEVFGDLDDSSSIPFLDLPPALDGLDVATLPSRGFGFDYSEVFGCRDPEGCAALYEEIFLVVPRGEYACSSKGRSTEESTSSHQARKESKHTPAYSSGSHMEWEEGHHLSPNSTSAYNVSTQINVSYSKSSRGIKEGAVNGETHITKLHAFPAFSFVVDSDTASGNGHLHNIEKDGFENEQNKSEATFSNTSKNSLKADQKHPTAKSPASGNDNANTSDNSCCSGISSTSGLISSCDAIFTNASDFSLLTQPMQVSPPSKSHPKFVDKKGHPKPRILSSPKICMDDVGDSSAAASAAVIEAIAFAQAKLKIAKELMEKKRDFPRKSKKLGHHESLKQNEQQLGQVRTGQESFGEMLVAPEKRNGITSAAKNAEKDNARALNKEEEQAKKEKDLELCELHKNSESKSMFLKMNEKYHELVNSEKYKTEEVSQTEHLIETTKVIKQNEKVNDSLSSEIESNRKLRKGYITPVACAHYVTDFLGAQGCDVKEVLEAQGVIKVPCAGEKTHFAGCEKNIEPSGHYTLHYFDDDKEENITVGLSVEASEDKSSYNFVQIDDENEESEMARPAELVKEINKSNIGSASNGEEMLNEVSETAAQSGIQVPQELCISHQQATEASCMNMVSKKTNRAENQNDTANEMGGTQLLHKEGKREEIHMKGRSCSTIENELRLEIDQETDELKKDFKKWNSTVETHEESNTTVKATKAACWPDCNVDKASEILVELQQKYKKEDSTPELSSIVDLEGINKINKDVQLSGNEGTIEIQVDHHFIDNIVCLNAVPGIYKGPLDMSLGFQSICLSDNQGESSYLTVVTMEDQPVTSQKNILDINKINQNKIESMGNMDQIEKPVTKKEENERLFEEANEKKKKLAEEKRKRLSEQAKYVEKEIEEGQEKEWLLEEETKRERKLKEEKKQERLLEAAKEMKVELVEEEQARLIEVKERQKEGEKEQLRSLQAEEGERMLEEKDGARLLEEVKEVECEVEESQSFIEEDKVSKSKLQKVNGRAKTLEENDLLKEENRLPLERETHEVQRTFAEARESTVQNYIHTVISEAPGKLFVEAQEKAEKSSDEHLKRSTEKASVKAILIPEGTAVELTTSQVHEYSTERVFAETVASGYDERHNTTSRDYTEKEIVTEENLISRDERSNLDDQGDTQSLGPGSFNNSQAISEPDGQQNKNFGKGEPALKCQVTVEKNQRIAERAAKALAEMNMREDLAQKEQAERNRLGEYLDADIRRWSNGKEGNLRALLSTLQYILGPDSGWQPVSFMDITTASAVKRVYRKATLCVHPDKLQQRSASVQRKYICEKVFDLLKDAWNKFNLEDR